MTSTAIYIHWPFCIKKCPYCDFNSFVSEKIDHEKWSNAYLRVIKDYYREFLHQKNISSIFFGGGTPSLATPKMIQEILNALSEIATFENNIEITLEANPTSVETEKFIQFKNAGINRVSLGIQSLREQNLQFLGRNHSVSEARSAIHTVKEIWQNYSLDFIYALPNQSLEHWKEELTEILLLESPHLSLYQLTVEQNTKFGAMARHGLFKEIDEEIAAKMFEMTYIMTQKHGLHRYEVSNHAKNSYESRHNLNYWQYGDYVGLGPGAHGRITKNNQKIMTADIKQPELWLTSVLQNKHGIQIIETLNDDEVNIEKIMMNMRTKFGVSLSLLQNKQYAVDHLLQHNLIYIQENHVIATENGVKVLNSIIETLAM